MDVVLRYGSCFAFDMAMFGPCMESCYVRCCLSDAWSVNGSCNVGCCFVLGMVQYRYCGELFVARIIDLLTDGMVDVFVFVSTERTVQYKLNAQFLRLFGVHSDVNDAHRAGANRLKNKTNKKYLESTIVPESSRTQ